MIELLNIAQLVLYIGLLALAGQGVLHLLAGPRRQANVFYQLFQVLNRPWLTLARWLSPGGLSPALRGWVAVAITGGLYLGVTLAKIEHCVRVAMVGCR